DRLLKALGAAVADKNDHTPMVLVGNEAAGVWTRTYGLAAPAAIVKVINDASERSKGESSSVEVPLPPDSTTTGQPQRQLRKTVNAAAATAGEPPSGSDAT